MISRTFARGFSSNVIKKLLVANRGEIARRVMRTARRLEICTVAVYSDADRHSEFVREADQAFHIGGAASAQSYLNVDRIVDVVKRTGSQGVHPGYGFLSENPVFQKAVEQAGAKFIGPPEKAIIAMGDKIASKKLARDAKVNTVPGFLGVIESPEEAIKIAQDIGYPVMIKASAGGGGKGMRIARSDQEAAEGFTMSKEEAKSSFGDDRVFIEKFIEEPHHIEFQILGDQQGNYVYLPERECSVQRRNQKVIEEAPAPLLSEAKRREMGEQACALAKTCGYFSTGTVEFLVDRQLENFYFLEMNTRLQVEHPITEEITGIDLVEQMIRIAEGRPLRITQKDVKINGHAVEYRIYAEDPSRNFLPSIGFLNRYAEPQPQTHLRIDTGVTEGSQISPYYDPMISKLIVHSPTRQEALEKLDIAADEYLIRGVRHNLGFCKAILANEAFVKGDYTTKFIPRFFPEGYQGPELAPAAPQIALVAAQKYAQNYLDSTTTPEKLYVLIGKDTYEVRKDGSVSQKSDDGAWTSVGAFQMNQDGYLCSVVGEDGQATLLQYVYENAGTPSAMVIGYRGCEVGVRVYLEKEYEVLGHMPPKVEIDTTKVVQSPMPGTVVSVLVKEGQKVMPGQTLAVLEAMKMQNMIKAEREAVVKAVHVQEGASVAVDELLVEFE